MADQVTNRTRVMDEKLVREADESIKATSKFFPILALIVVLLILYLLFFKARAWQKEKAKNAQTTNGPVFKNGETKEEVTSTGVTVSRLYFITGPETKDVRWFTPPPNSRVRYQVFRGMPSAWRETMRGDGKVGMGKITPITEEPDPTVDHIDLGTQMRIWATKRTTVVITWVSPGSDWGKAFPHG